MPKGREGYRPAGEEIRPEVDKPSLPEEAERVLRENDKEKVLEVAKDLDPKYHSEFAIRVLNEFDSISLSHSLIQELQGLNAEVSKACQNYELVTLVGQNLDNFQAIDQYAAFALARYGSKEVKKKLFESADRLGLDKTKLIEDLLYVGRGFTVLENRDLLSEISPEKLVEMFVESAETEVLIVNLPNHPEFDQAMVIKKIMSLPHPEVVKIIFDEIDNFDHLDHNELVKDMLEATEVHDGEPEEDDAEKEFIKYQKRRVFFDNLGKLEGLSSETADRLLKTEDYPIEKLLRDLKSFKGLDMEKIEEKARKENKIYLIAEKIDHFPHIDKQQFAEELKKTDIHLLLDNIRKFPEIDHAALGDDLIAEGWGKLFIRTSRRLNAISPEAADYLWDNMQYSSYADALHKLTGIPVDRGLDLVEIGFVAQVINNIHRFESSGQSKIIDAVLEVNPGAVAGYMNKISELTPDQGYRLAATGFGEVVIAHLDKVPGIDHEKIARYLIKNAQPEVLFKHFEKIQIKDWNKLLELAVRTGNGWDVFAQLHRFESYDKDALLDVLLAKNELSLAAEYIHYFEAKRHQEVAMVLLERGHVSEFQSNINKFKDLINWRELIDKNIKTVLNIAWQVPVEIISQLDEKDQQRFKLRLERGVSEKMFLLKYDELLPYIESGLVDLELPGYSKEQLQRHIDQVMENLQKKGLEYLAAQVAECAEASGLEVNHAELNKLRQAEREEEARRENREAREVDLGNHEVADEMTRFYVYQLISSHLPAKRLNYEAWGIKLPHRDRVALNDITRQAEPFNEELYKWMKDYGVFAVVSELSHQADVFPRQEWLELPQMEVPEWDIAVKDRANVDVFLKYATKQEIGEFLHQASLVFRKRGWYTSFGGEPWAKIAEVVAEAWQEKYPEEVVCDRIFDLEHNSGMIFDKRPDRIRAENSELQKILDFKFKAKGDVDEWLEEIPKMEISDQTTRHLTNSLKTFKRLQPQLNKMQAKYTGQFS